MRTIYWTKPTESGLGDRLSDILFMSTYARLHQSNLLLTWNVYRGHEKIETRALDPAFRYVDSRLENVKKYINFPNNTIVEPFVQVETYKTKNWIINDDEIRIIRLNYPTFEFALGGGNDPRRFWLAYCQDKVSTYEEFQQHLDAVGKEFSFCEEINKYLSSLPDRFASFHIRRGDKIRSGEIDGMHVHTNELKELNQLTYKCIDVFCDRYDNFFICGDQDEKKKEFIDYIISKKKNIITVPSYLDKWQQTYFDLATMTKSAINITSNRYSAFSRFPSLIGNKRYKSVFQLDQEGYYEDR
jgi:hypothetical protein